MKKFPEIIERVEYVRKYFGLNKSEFSARIGMKPQTYNNFIGSQGSKPNIELIFGVVNEFEVNPHWLLNGVGEKILAGQGSAERLQPLSASASKARGTTPERILKDVSAYLDADPVGALREFKHVVNILQKRYSK